MKVCDMHCDTLTVLKDQNKNFFSNDLHISLEKMEQGNYLSQCFAVFINLNKKAPYKRCVDYINYFYKLMDENSNIIKQAKNYQDIINNNKEYKMSAILTIEEGETIEGSLEKLQYFYDRGVRMMTLTWNYPNQIGFPNIDATKEVKEITSVNTVDGLTEFGIKVVKKMNELGMIVDCSHLSDKGFYDVIKYSSSPIVCSHSNSRTIQNVSRNLSDDMILMLKENGGIMGINYCHDFISYSNEDQIQDIIKHIKHIVKIGGIDICALGSDFDGIGTVKGMSDCTKTNVLYDELLKSGFSNEEVDKIFYKNFLRVFKQVCK